MGITYNGKEMESMIHDGIEVETWIHNGVEVYTAGKMVTYCVDTGTSYQEKVKKGHSCLSPTTFTPTKSGWTFVGWREDTTAASSVLSAKVMEKSAITLYAVFKQDVTLTTYNGSSTATKSTKQRYYNNGNTNNPSWTLSQASISGWSANGWCTSSGATAGIAVSNGGSVTLSSNATYYGRYSQTIYLYYNGNGSTGGSTATQSGTRYYNSGNYSNPSFTIRSNGYSRTNASFKNWALNSTSGTRYNQGASITLSSNATLYAKWTVTTSNSETAYYTIPGGKITTKDGNNILYATGMSGGGNVLKLSNNYPQLSRWVNSLSISLSAKMRIPGWENGDRGKFKLVLYSNGNAKNTVKTITCEKEREEIDFSSNTSNVDAGSFYYKLVYVDGYNGPRFEDSRTMTVKASYTSTYEA